MPTIKEIMIESIFKECRDNNLDADRKWVNKFLKHLQIDTLREIHKDLKIYKGKSKYKEE